ncbi:tetratricopeptide repeat protein [Marinomonas vulgaris]|nr:tetratricopeptide repeat protein [Marinomonas vulgaris]
MPAILRRQHYTVSKCARAFGLLTTWLHASLLFVCAYLLVACTQNPEKPQPQALGEQTVATSPSSNDTLSGLLNAEFTLQREGPSQAFETFYRLASTSSDIRLIERLTRIAIMSQNPFYIERSANLWLSVVPNSEPAFSLKLQILIKNNRAEEAATLLTNALRQQVSLRFLALYLEDNIRDNDQVTTIENAIMALPPETRRDQYVKLSYAHILLLSGEYQAAIDVTNALLSSPDTEKSEALYLILAFSQKNLEKTDKAIQTLQTASSTIPNNIRLLTPLMEFLVADEQPNNAFILYRTAQLNTAEQLQVGINLMSTLIDHHQAELALTTAQHFPKEQLGLSDQVQYLTAIALAQQKKMTDAISIMYRITGPLRANATSQMALWLYDIGKADEINAMVLSRTLRENMPEQVAAIGALHEEKGRADLSYDLSSRALSALPESNALRYHKALLADRLGQWQVTEHELRVLLKKDPDNAQYLNALGYTLLTRTSRLDEAMRYIELAYEKSDDDPAIIDSLGWGFFMKGELERSTYYLKKAWSILPDADIAAHYGESLWKQRHYKEAIVVWEAALTTSPNAPLLLNTIKRLSPSLLEDSK